VSKKGGESLAIDAGTVVAFMELDTSRFTSGLSSAGQQMRQFMDSSNSAETRMQSLGGAMQSTGSVATKAVTLPLVGIGAAAVKTSMDFGAQMSSVQAISGATGNEFNKLREQAIELGADTAFSATEAAEGQENLASAGFKTSEILEAMPGMLDLAAAGNVDIATASDIAGSSLRGFGLEASQATHVADVLAKAAADTNAGITDTGEAMKYIAPVANALGISFEDTTAAIGLLSNAGIKGSQAGTTLRSALTNLASPTDAAAQLMEQLGMNFFDAQGKMLPLGDVIQQLKDKTSGLTQQQKASAMQTLFGKEAMSGMLALVDQGPEKFNELEKGLKNCDGAGKEMASTMQDNLKGAIEGMKGSIETMGIRIGDVLAPGIRKAADFIGKLADGFSNLPRPIQTFIVYLGLAAAAFGPVMIIFGKIITSTATVVGALGKIGTAVRSLGTIFSGLRTATSAFAALPGLISPPVLITIGIIAGLGLIIYEVIKHWDSFKKYASAFGNAIKSIFKAVGEFIGSAVKGWGLIFEGFSKLLKMSVEGWIILFKGFGEFIKAAVEGWKLIFSGLGNAMKAIGKFIFEGLFEGISSMAGKIKDKVASIAESISSTFKKVLGIHSPSRVFMQFAGYISEGLIEGLRLKDKYVVDKVADTANAIASKFTNILGIRSPSTVFTKYGENIGDGLVIGLRNKEALVLGSFENLTSNMLKQQSFPKKTQEEFKADGSIPKEEKQPKLAMPILFIDFESNIKEAQKAGGNIAKAYIDGINEGLKDYQLPTPINKSLDDYSKKATNAIDGLKNTQQTEISTLNTIESAQTNLFSGWTNAGKVQISQMEELIRRQKELTNILNTVSYNTTLMRTVYAYKVLSDQARNFGNVATNAWADANTYGSQYANKLTEIAKAHQEMFKVADPIISRLTYGQVVLCHNAESYHDALQKIIQDFNILTPLMDKFVKESHEGWEKLIRDANIYNRALIVLIETHKILNKVMGDSINLWIRLLRGFGAFLYYAVEGWKIILGGLGIAFYNVGKFIVEGLIGGIGSVLGKLKAAVGSVASVVKEGIKEALGIHSPSKVMEEYGVFTGQGYINGLAAIQGKLGQQVNKFSEEILGIGKVKPDLDDIALSGAYNGSSKETLNRINNLSTSKLLNFEPKITLYVTVADTGEKGTQKLTSEVKTMSGNALKDAMTQLFMNDVIRD